MKIIWNCRKMAVLNCSSKRVKYLLVSNTQVESQLENLRKHGYGRWKISEKFSFLVEKISLLFGEFSFARHAWSICNFYSTLYCCEFTLTWNFHLEINFVQWQNFIIYFTFNFFVCLTHSWFCTLIYWSAKIQK